MNGLAHITIAGQKVGLKFGLPAVKRIMEKMVDHELQLKNGDYTELGITHVIYAGYLNYCIMHDESPKILFNQFYEQIELLEDDVTKEEAIKAIRSFEESKCVTRILAANKEEDEKKKAMKTLNQSTGIESNPSVSESLVTDREIIVD